MNTRVHMVVLCKGVKKCMTFMFFRAQFGQSRSFNSLSHKNLIMNMEPLVPALPSTNEYEETAVDSGRRILLTTDPNTHNRHALMPSLRDICEVTWDLPCVGRSPCTKLREREL